MMSLFILNSQLIFQMRKWSWSKWSGSKFCETGHFWDVHGTSTHAISRGHVVAITASHETSCFLHFTLRGYRLEWKCYRAEGSLIQSPLLLSRATVQIFPGKKCRLCFSPFHSGTVFTRVPLLVYHYLWTKWLILFPTIVKMTNNIISDRGSQNLMLKDFIWCLWFHISDE